MARQSRPPGFDMTYRPERRIAFGPPLRQRATSFGYLAFALAVCALIVYGQQFAPSGSRVFQYVVEGDRHRIMPSGVCAIILFSSALAMVLREGMRGVVLHPDGIELRDLLAFGLPRVRRFAWSQIDRVFLPAAAETKPIRLDLWDGTQTWLPVVARATDLGILLERVALARAIPVEGGTGMVDDLGNPLTEEDAEVA